MINVKNFEVGDVIMMDETVSYQKTGKTLEFTIDSEQLLEDIIKYESKENWHNMRIKLNQNKDE